MIKKLIYILILIVIFNNSAKADMLEAEVRYGSVPYEFKYGDEKKFLENANVAMLLADRAKTPDEKSYYLQDAMHYYFMVEKINKTSIEAQIGLAKIYDELKFDRIAKRHFYTALCINSQNPSANLSFANFYYKRNDLIKALKYYNRAYKFGYNNNYYLNERLGTVYEKLADINNAKKFYQSAYTLNSSSKALSNKIRLLDDLNYSNSQYYLFERQGIGNKILNEN